jgi:hypothetical protein
LLKKYQHAETEDMDLSKVLNGRVATEADAETRSVIFYIPDSRSTPYVFEHDLPLRARFISQEESGIAPDGTEVIVAQAEVGDNGQIVVGLLLGEDEEGICMLHELEILGPLR